MTSNVKQFPGSKPAESDDLAPSTVLEEAGKENLIRVLVIGETAEGALFFSSSSGNAAELLLDLKLTERAVLDMVDGG
jgi:hypothetical protein